MTKELKIFENAQFGQIRTTIAENGEPLFCLADVCKSLDLRSTDVVRRLSDDVVTNHPISDSLGREQLANFVNEDGFYDVVLDSRKPEAKAFRKWITSEVLPSIRKSGGYLVTSDTDTEDEILAKAVLVAQKTIERKDQRIKQLEHDAAAQAKQLTEQASTIKQQNKQIDELQSKATYLDQILQSKSTVTTSQIAQDYGMSAKRFNQLLHDLKIQRKVNGQWILFAPYTERGYVHSETINLPVVVNGVEYTKTVMHTKWLQSGRLFLYNMLKKNNILPLIER